MMVAAVQVVALYGQREKNYALQKKNKKLSRNRTRKTLLFGRLFWSVTIVKQAEITGDPYRTMNETVTKLNTSTVNCNNCNYNNSNTHTYRQYTFVGHCPVDTGMQKKSIRKELYKILVFKQGIQFEFQFKV